MTIDDVIKRHDLTQTGLARMTGIPIRTVQDWVAERRTPPDWVVGLILFYVEHYVP